MASSVMHLCATMLALPQHPRLDLVLLGSVMPDGFPQPKISHWRVKNADGTYGFDVEGFLQEYGAEAGEDPYVLGYLMHLVQDRHYRQVVHRRNDWNGGDPAFSEALHMDYWYLNPPLVARFHPFLPETIPEDIRRHPLCPPDAEAFLQEKREELVDPTTGSLTVLTEAMAVEWIEEAAEICRRFF